MNINQLFETLASDNSRIFKTSLLQTHKDNEVLRESIRLALDPFTQFYQRKIPNYSYNASRPNYDLKQALKDLKVLYTRELTGNAAIAFLSDLLGCLNEDDAKVVERIIKKDLKCGVSLGTANAVWPSLIHEYPCMLCSGYEDKLVSKIKWPALAQKKEDGMRFNAIVKDGKVEFRARSGKELDLLGYLDQEFLTIAKGENLVFDGELLIELPDGNFAPRQEGNGILSKAGKGTISGTEANQVRAQLWDVIPFENFISGNYKTGYSTRLEKLNELIKLSSGKLHVVETAEVNSIEEARIIFNKYLLEGFEGIILKDSSSIWENKRSKSQIKFKAELEADLKIVGIQEGTGKYIGKLGAIDVESNDGVIRVSVGSGFSDDQRSNLAEWLDRIGQIVAVKYNARLKNKDGEESLFLPIFIEIRDDKSIADSSKDIK